MKASTVHAVASVSFRLNVIIDFFIYFLCTVTTGSSAMDMQALLVKDLQWRTSMKLESMALMGKSLVFLESLMVYMFLSSTYISHMVRCQCSDEANVYVQDMEVHVQLNM